MLMLLCAVTTWAQSSLRISEGLLGTKENVQYKWTSGKLTAPGGDFNKLRVTFMETSNNEKPAGFPCVAIAEFYLYDKDGKQVELAEGNFSSNATQSNEGSMAAICDGVTTGDQDKYDWYWHSQWGATPDPYGYHYLEIDLTNVEADLSEYSFGWVTRREQASPKDIIVSAGATTEAVAQGYDNVYLSSLLTTNEDAPVYFAIRNIRNGDYCASYTRENMNLALGTTKTKASVFYFTGSVQNGLATVKIHNYEADGVCMADFASWTEEGINWYIQLSGDTNKRGFAISKVNDLTDNAYSWNNDASNNIKVSPYKGNDPGSTFMFVKLTAEEVANLTNEFISDPENLVSGTSYRFRSLSGYKYIAGGDVNVGTNNIAGDNTAFAYYVSPNTGAKYLYNISSKKFIGTTSEANASIPLTDKPVSTELTFKKSGNAVYPIMMSTNKGGGAINYSGWYGQIINWQGGFGDTGSADNSFMAEKVDLVKDETLATIEDLVGVFEGESKKEELRSLIEKLTAYTSSTAVGGYTEDAITELRVAIDVAQNVYNATPTFEEVVTAIENLNNAVANLAIVLPVEGTFYVIRNAQTNTCVYSKADNKLYHAEGVTNASVWQFVKNEDGSFKLYNVNNGQFLKSLVWLNPSLLGDDACKVEISSCNVAGENCVFIKGGGQQMHAQEGGDAPVVYYNEDSGKLSKSSWVIEEFDGTLSHTLTVGAAGYATLMLGYNTTIPSDITGEDFGVYTATINGGWAVLNKVEGVLPANTAVIVKAPEGKCEFVYTAEAATSNVENNDLRGTLYDKYIAEEAYVLSALNNEVGFYKAKYNVSTDTTNDGTEEAPEVTYEAWKNNANKAYLPAPANAAESYGLRLPGTTAIEDVVVENEVKVIYDLTGRRVEAITAAGIYIVNGKKVLVK